MWTHANSRHNIFFFAKYGIGYVNELMSERDKNRTVTKKSQDVCDESQTHIYLTFKSAFEDLSSVTKRNILLCIRAYFGFGVGQ